MTDGSKPVKTSVDKSKIKPIETRYKGYRFRSRLEARWAVFFDALGVQWEYEPEGYDLGDAGWYLPDFWLPKAANGCWVEIKGGKPNQAERDKAAALADQSGYPVVMYCGAPSYNASLWDEGLFVPNVYVEAFTGYNPPPEEDLPGSFKTCDLETNALSYFLRSKGYNVSDYKFDRLSIIEIIQSDQDYYKSRHGVDHPHYWRGWWQRGIGTLDTYAMLCEDYRTCVKAIKSARSARFEHGENT